MSEPFNVIVLTSPSYPRCSTCEDSNSWNLKLGDGRTKEEEILSIEFYDLQKYGLPYFSSDWISNHLSCSTWDDGGCENDEDELKNIAKCVNNRSFCKHRFSLLKEEKDGSSRLFQCDACELWVVQYRSNESMEQGKSFQTKFNQWLVETFPNGHEKEYQEIRRIIFGKYTTRTQFEELENASEKRKLLSLISPVFGTKKSPANSKKQKVEESKSKEKKVEQQKEDSFHLHLDLKEACQSLLESEASRLTHQPFGDNFAVGECVNKKKRKLFKECTHDFQFHHYKEEKLAVSFQCNKCKLFVDVN